MVEFTSDEKVKNTVMSLNETVTTEIGYACALLDLDRRERIRVLIELCQHVLEEINDEISAEADEEAKVKGTTDDQRNSDQGDAGRVR